MLVLAIISKISHLKQSMIKMEEAIITSYGAGNEDL